MAKHAIAVLVIVALILVGDRFAGAVLSHVVDISQFRYSRMYAGNLDVDVVTIGNSRGIFALNAPMISQRTNLSAFNLSFNGLDFQTSLLLIRDYFDRNAPPKLLIMEISNVSNNSPPSPGVAKLYSHRSERLRSYLHDTYPTIGIASEIFRLYRLNDELFFRTVASLKNSDQNWLMTAVSTEAGIARAIATALPFETPRPQNLKALKDFIDFTEAKGTKTILVMAPFLHSYAEKIGNIGQWIADLRQATGNRVPIVDLSTAIAAADAFADPVHLSPTGSEQFADLLVSRGIFDGILGFHAIAMDKREATHPTR